MGTILIAGLILLTAAEPATPVEALVGRLGERQNRIQTIRCEYVNHGNATDAYIDRSARETNRPRAKVVKQFTTNLRGTFTEAKAGYFRIVLTKLDEKNDPARRRLITNNRREGWHLSYGSVGEEAGPPTVEVGSDSGFRDMYEAECMMRRFAGVALIPGSRGLAEAISGGAEVTLLAGEEVGGSPCVAVRWETPGLVRPQRETAWFDSAHGLAPRRYQVEIQPTDRDDWVTIHRWDVLEVFPAQAGALGDGGSPFWAPKTVTAIVNDTFGNLILEDVYEISECVINERLSPGEFVPSIEQGSNVYDLKTNKVTVHGGGSSPRRSQLVRRRVEEAEKLAREAGAGDDQALGHIDPPVSWSSYSGWAALSLGVVGLISALWLRRRS